MATGVTTNVFVDGKGMIFQVCACLVSAASVPPNFRQTTTNVH